MLFCLAVSPSEAIQPRESENCLNVAWCERPARDAENQAGNWHSSRWTANNWTTWKSWDHQIANVLFVQAGTFCSKGVRLLQAEHGCSPAVCQSLESSSPSLVCWVYLSIILSILRRSEEYLLWVTSWLFSAWVLFGPGGSSNATKHGRCWWLGVQNVIAPATGAKRTGDHSNDQIKMYI